MTWDGLVIVCGSIVAEGDASLGSVQLVGLGLLAFDRLFSVLSV
jgi:hypothetical protein